VIGFPSDEKSGASGSNKIQFSTMPASPSGSIFNDPAALVQCGANNTFVITRLKQVYIVGLAISVLASKCVYCVCVHMFGYCSVEIYIPFSFFEVLSCTHCML
jgi:hypothetical protein